MEALVCWIYFPSSSSSSSSLFSYQSRLLIRQIRRSLESGEIDAPLDLLRVHAPFALEDHRLLFRLQKLKFIELLRKGTLEDRDAAFNCFRTALAPCALDAYPVGYQAPVQTVIRGDLNLCIAQHWRCQPHGCNLRRWNVTEMWEKLRGKRHMFVGDSLNRSQWIGMVCLMQFAIPVDKCSITPQAHLTTFRAESNMLIEDCEKGSVQV